MFIECLSGPGTPVYLWHVFTQLSQTLPGRSLVIPILWVVMQRPREMRVAVAWDPQKRGEQVLSSAAICEWSLCAQEDSALWLAVL